MRSRRSWRWPCVLCGLALSLLWPSVASAQAITAYEFSFSATAGGSTPKPLTAPAVGVSCVTGRAPAVPATVWLSPTDPLKILFEPDTTRVCTWLGPPASTLGLTTGSTYTLSAVAINEAGIRSVTPSPASSPFGLAGPPPNILRVVVLSGS